jgi:phosphate transport system substrate-binding protein
MLYRKSGQIMRWTFAGWKYVNWKLAILLCLIVLVLGGTSGCQLLLQPLAGPQGVNTEPTPGEPRILRIVACYEAIPLLHDLEATYRARYPNTIIQVEAMESALARQTLAAGQADLALVVEEPDVQGVTSTQILVGGPQSQVIAYDALVIAVAATSSLSALSSAQLKDLYAGRIIDWAEIGSGSGRPYFVTREAGSASRRLFEDLIMQGETISTAAVVMPSDAAVRDYLGKHPNAIGFLSLTYLDVNLKAVALDGQTPSTTTIESGAYPLVRSIAALLAPIPMQEAQEWLSLATANQGCRLMQYHYACAH